MIVWWSLEGLCVKGVTAKWILELVEAEFMASPKSKLQPESRLKWLGEDLRLGLGGEELLDAEDVGVGIGNVEGARRIGLAKWFVLALKECIRKQIKSALGKLVRLARPHVGWAPMVAGMCAHMLRGAPCKNRPPLAILRPLALLLVFSCIE